MITSSIPLPLTDHRGLARDRIYIYIFNVYISPPSLGLTVYNIITLSIDSGRLPQGPRQEIQHRFLILHQISSFYLLQFCCSFTGDDWRSYFDTPPPPHFFLIRGVLTRGKEYGSLNRRSEESFLNHNIYRWLMVVFL